MYYILSALSDLEIYMFHFFRESIICHSVRLINIFFSINILVCFCFSEDRNHLHSNLFFDIIISRNSRFLSCLYLFLFEVLSDKRTNKNGRRSLIAANCFINSNQAKYFFYILLNIYVFYGDANNQGIWRFGTIIDI